MKQKNLCQLFWTFFLSLVFVWPVIIFLGLPLALVVVVGYFAIGLLFAVRPPIFKNDADRDFIDYKHWPKWRGQNIPPILILPIILMVWIAVAGRTILLEIFTGIITFFTLQSTWLATGLAILLFALIPVIRTLAKGGVFRLTSAYLKAKKEKVCPLVEFVEKE